MPSRDARDAGRNVPSIFTTDELNVVEAKGYTLLNLLGEGSYAKVYKAEYRPPLKSASGHQTGEKTVQRLACKIINGKLASKEFVEKFLPRELSIITKLDHKNIIRIHSIIFMVDLKKWFIFMQLGENGDLLKFITEYGPLRERRARLLFTQLLSAIDYLHKRSIVHRDVKCENVLLTPAYNIKLSDFGFAKEVSKIPEKDEYVKSTTFCGSLQYAAPEIIRGVEHNPFLVDIWSCGILLYVILNQALPFEQTSRKSLYSAQMKKSWKWRKFVSTRVSSNLKAFLPRLLQPQPQRRIPADQLLHYPWIMEEIPQNSTVTPNSPEPISMMTLKAVPSAMEHRFVPAATEVMNIAIHTEVFKSPSGSSTLLVDDNG